MVKMMRDNAHDAALIRERDAQKTAAGLITLFRVPEVLFEDVFMEHAVYAETVAPGTPIGRERSVSYLRLLSDAQNVVRKEGEIDLSAMRALIASEHISDSRMQDALVALEKVSGPIYRSWSHGDLTYANLIDGAEGPFIIDWERFNERPIWGIDLAHYAARSLDVATAEQLAVRIEETQTRIDAPPGYLKDVYILDTVMDMLDKWHPSVYAKLVILLATAV